MEWRTALTELEQRKVLANRILYTVRKHYEDFKRHCFYCSLVLLDRKLIDIDCQTYTN